MIYGRTHTRDITKLGGMMKILPFIGAIYVITGLAYLGLPGFSGFVAEMNIFVGAFQQNADTFNRILTILGGVFHRGYISIYSYDWLEK